MSELVTVVIECFFNNNEAKYEFLIESNQSEQLLSDYCVAVTNKSTLRVNYSTGGFKDVMILSGGLLRNSTIRIDNGE